jgi:Proteolysis_6 C-terminal
MIKIEFFQYFEKLKFHISKIESRALLKFHLLPKRGFNLITLDHKFGDLCKIYLHKKCEICQGFPNKGEICICLICNMVLCSIACGKKEKTILSGALNDHAQQKHVGNSVFLGVFSCKIYWIASGKNFMGQCKHFN